MFKNTRFLKFIKSFRFRMILIICVLAVLPGALIRIGIIGFYESRAVSLRQSEILGQANALTNQIATSEYFMPGSESSSGDSTIHAQIDMLTNLYEGRVILVDSSFRIVFDTFNLDDQKIILSEEVILTFNGEESMIAYYDPDNDYIEIALPVIAPEDASSQILGVMLISVSTDNIEINKNYLRQIALVLQLVIAAVVILAGVSYANYSMREFSKIRDGIADERNGLSGELAVNRYTETEDICRELNLLIAQMRVTDESRQEFVSNVSHELKTPLTSMKVLADSINSMPDAPKELYQEFFADITNEVERETKIINDLLSLVKMDKSAVAPNIASTNVNELLEQIMKRLQPIADKQKVALVLESFRPVTAEVDEVKLTLAFTNLIENAIKYNRTGGDGWVHVTLNADHQFFFLKVEDNGIGIPEDSLEHIYERFYRVDKSHSREIGGTGLGLAITRNAILMHRGAIKAYSQPDVGTTFDVRIPLNYIV